MPAGNHTKPHQNALDCVVSSYTHTIKALAYASDQLKDVRQTIVSEPQRVLLVSMAKTPERLDLPYVDAEIQAVMHLISPHMTTDILTLPSKPLVHEKQQQASVVHFACRGEFADDPSDSLIMFSDWKADPFFLTDMVRMKLDITQFAYLSVCHASSDRNVSLIEEGINMAGACQLAGYPGVVGTLWQISDDRSPRIAESIYETMYTTSNVLDFRKAAIGLHHARLKQETQ